MSCLCYQGTLLFVRKLIKYAKARSHPIVILMPCFGHVYFLRFCIILLDAMAFVYPLTMLSVAFLIHQENAYTSVHLSHRYSC